MFWIFIFSFADGFHFAFLAELLHFFLSTFFFFIINLYHLRRWFLFFYFLRNQLFFVVIFWVETLLLWFWTLSIKNAPFLLERLLLFRLILCWFLNYYLVLLFNLCLLHLWLFYLFINHRFFYFWQFYSAIHSACPCLLWPFNCLFFAQKMQLVALSSDNLGEVDVFFCTSFS